MKVHLVIKKCYFKYIMLKSYKELHSFETRHEEHTRMKQKYPDRIPVIIEPAIGCKLNVIDKKKFLVPHDLTIGQLLHVIRKRILLSKNEGLYIFIDKKIPPSSALVMTIYEDCKDADGFLYITYTGENTFGK